jgi:hypothetical protein
MICVQHCHAANSEKTDAFAAYSNAFLRGADHLCQQTERAMKRLENMIQAQCVASDMRAGKDPIDTSRHCFGADQRSGFVRAAEEFRGNP